MSNVLKTMITLVFDDEEVKQQTQVVDQLFFSAKTREKRAKKRRRGIENNLDCAKEEGRRSPKKKSPASLTGISDN
jgi:hypothetical protein